MSTFRWLVNTTRRQSNGTFFTGFMCEILALCSNASCTEHDEETTSSVTLYLYSFQNEHPRNIAVEMDDVPQKGSGILHRIYQRVREVPLSKFLHNRSDYSPPLKFDSWNQMVVKHQKLYTSSSQTVGSLTSAVVPEGTGFRIAVQVSIFGKANTLSNMNVICNEDSFLIHIPMCKKSLKPEKVNVIKSPANKQRRLMENSGKEEHSARLTKYVKKVTVNELIQKTNTKKYLQKLRKLYVQQKYGTCNDSKKSVNIGLSLTTDGTLPILARPTLTSAGIPLRAVGPPLIAGGLSLKSTGQSLTSVRSTLTAVGPSLTSAKPSQTAVGPPLITGGPSLIAASHHTCSTSDNKRTRMHRHVATDDKQKVRNASSGMTSQQTNNKRIFTDVEKMFRQLDVMAIQTNILRGPKHSDNKVNSLKHGSKSSHDITTDSPGRLSDGEVRQFPLIGVPDHLLPRVRFNMIPDVQYYEKTND